MSDKTALENIWDVLSNDPDTKLKSNNFEEWSNSFIEDPDVQTNVYNYLVNNDANLTANNQQEWSESVTSEYSAHVVLNQVNIDEKKDNTGLLKGCTDNLAKNYNPDAVEDDGSCEYDPVLLSQVNINEKKYIDRMLPDVIEAKLRYEENKALLDRTTVKVVDNVEKLVDKKDGIVDDIFNQNIKKTEIEYFKDRNGNEDTDVKELTKIGGIAKTEDVDGDVTYHYTEFLEDGKTPNPNYKTGWFTRNKASKEDIKLFPDAITYAVKES